MGLISLASLWANFLDLRGDVRMSFCTATYNWPTDRLSVDIRMFMGHWRNDNWQKTEVIWDKPAPLIFHPPHVTHELPWNWTWPPAIISTEWPCTCAVIIIQGHCFSLFITYYRLAYDTMYFLTAIGLSPNGRSTVHLYTQTIHRTIQNKQYIQKHNNFGRVPAVPRLG